MIRTNAWNVADVTRYVKGKKYMPIKQKLTKLTNSISRYGIIGTWQKFYERKFAPWNTDEPDWQKYLPTEEELEKQRRQLKEEPFKYNPLISIVVPTYETPEKFFLTFFS